MESSRTRFIIIEPCNFVDSPAGGQLNFARLMLSIYGSKVATVGNTTLQYEPVGVWFKKTENGVTRDHFNLGFRDVSKERYLIPRRLRSLIAYRRYRYRIHLHPCRRFFIQEHAILMGFYRKAAANVCYRFPGVESQLKKSRFFWAIPIARIFDYVFYRSTKKADVLLASADKEAIDEMLQSSFGFLDGREIIQFPTRVDTTIFSRKPSAARSYPLKFISVGRLHWVKGWDLILEALALLKGKIDFSYTYIGDGPDREAFQARAAELGLLNSVRLAGFMKPTEIAERLRASDLYLMGSVMEGWPTTLVEAYVTGLPMVSTAVSGARVIIKDGVNGVICAERLASRYAACIEAALALDWERIRETANPEIYSISTLMQDLDNLWKE